MGVAAEKEAAKQRMVREAVAAHGKPVDEVVQTVLEKLDTKKEMEALLSQLKGSPVVESKPLDGGGVDPVPAKADDTAEKAKARAANVHEAASAATSVLGSRVLKEAK